MSQMLRPVWRKILLACVIAGASLSSVAAQDEARMRRWERFDFAARRLDQTQLRNVPLEELRLLRGIVFGRHGRIFKDRDIREYLAKRPWYKPDPNFQNSMLNQMERRNLDIIREGEARKHEFVEPGDLRFYSARAITAKQLGEHTGAEWRILHAEIEALHGKSFADEPWLQKYFEERYWYRASDRYDAKTLTAIERANMRTIAAAQKRQRRVALSPGDMELFQNTILAEDKLRGLSLYELRLLRNEFYARRGRTFRTEWLQQYFYQQDWYEAAMNDDGSVREPELTATEKTNVETILRYENRMHEELSTKLLSRATLQGLFLEDARKLRNEILARRGMTFKDAWLQNYFASFDWYKPDPSFSEANLTDVERRNVATLRLYERDATSEADAIEG